MICFVGSLILHFKRVNLFDPLHHISLDGCRGILKKDHIEKAVNTLTAIITLQIQTYFVSVKHISIHKFNSIQFIFFNLNAADLENYGLDDK